MIMVDCDEKREKLRLLQFADVERAIDKIYAVAVYDDSKCVLKKPEYIKTSARWHAMILSVMRNNTQYNNDIDEICLKI